MEKDYCNLKKARIPTIRLGNIIKKVFAFTQIFKKLVFLQNRNCLKEINKREIVMKCLGVNVGGAKLKNNIEKANKNQ